MKTVFFDVDTQLDFVYPAGALFVPGAQHLTAAFSALTRFAASKNIQILSTADAHTEDDPEFRVWKPHCVAGTVGQTKAIGTLLPGALKITTAAGALQIHGPAAFRSAPQIILEKQQLDAFSNPNLLLLLEALGPARFVLYGVVTEYCVGAAALGLLRTGAEVELVEDAVKGLSPADAHDLIERIQAHGGKLTNVQKVLSYS